MLLMFSSEESSVPVPQAGRIEASVADVVAKVTVFLSPTYIPDLAYISLKLLFLVLLMES